MKVVIDRIHYPVTSLGPGRRVGVWFQGCSIGCRGCLSLDTWDRDARPPSSVDALAAAIRALCPDGPDGVTISGGEPFEQPAALRALVAEIRRWATTLSRDIDILVYSGYPLADLRSRHPDLLDELDAIIPEPYVAADAPDGPWRGSGNQPLVLLSELGRRRFEGHRPEQPQMQAVAADGSLWMIGVPRPGDLPRLTAGLRDRGIDLTEVSWRP